VAAGREARTRASAKRRRGPRASARRSDRSEDRRRGSGLAGLVSIARFRARGFSRAARREAPYVWVLHNDEQSRSKAFRIVWSATTTKGVSGSRLLAPLTPRRGGSSSSRNVRLAPVRAPLGEALRRRGQPWIGGGAIDARAPTRGGSLAPCPAGPALAVGSPRWSCSSADTG
jgi:hypothetical protein